MTTSLDHTVRGSGPGLLLAHGASSDVPDSFGPILDGLARHNTVVAPNYPGSGRTPRSEAPLTLDGLADRLVATAVDAGLERFALLGFSTGSPVAVRAATRHPERVTALVLSAGFAYPNARLRLIVDLWRTLDDTADQSTLAAYLTLMVFGTPWLDACTPGQLDTLRREAAAALPPGADDQLALLLSVDVRPDLPKIHVPTLVVAATGDHIASPAHARELTENIPGARRVDLDCGHAIGFEQPDAWLSAITGFLDETAR
ncbi:alpha/beta fold hydrolase [Spirillospora sp. CA-294931]|uniref:alpha/beta fold hydrolase n=1 Tax=Spirillospora sp. CA-294931 TaxID=3240042 RepID=UPI003D8CB01F